MNQVQQRSHRTATQTLARQLEALSDDATTLIGALDERVAQNAKAFASALSEEQSKRIQLAEELRGLIVAERTHRLKLADEQRLYVDRVDKITYGQLERFIGRGFWARLNWLLTGR